MPVSAPSFTGAFAFGAAKSEAIYGVATDGTSTWVAGSFDETTDIGGGTLTSLGGRDAIVAKYAAGGAHQWTLHIGGTGEQTAASVAVAPSGESAAGILFNNAVTVGGKTYTAVGDADLLFVRLSPSGNVLGAQQIGSPGDDALPNVAIDSSGGIVATAHMRGGVDLGPKKTTFSGGASDGLIARYDSTSALQWVLTFGNPSSGKEAGGGITVVHPSGDVIVAARVVGTVVFGGKTVGSDSDGTVLAAINPKGEVKWARALPLFVARIALDSKGDIVLIGEAPSAGKVATCDIAPGSVIAKFAADGSTKWVRTFASAGRTFGSISIDGADNAVAVIEAFDPLAVEGAMLNGTVIVSLTPGGGVRYSRSFTGGTRLARVATAGTKTVVAGMFSGTLTYAAGGSLTSKGMDDGFVLTLGP